MKKRNLDMVLKRLWLFVAIVSVALVFYGILLGVFNSDVYLGPEYEVDVTIVGDYPDSGLKTAVNYFLVGTVVVLVLVTIALLVVFYMKRRRMKQVKSIPKFDVLGVR